MSYGAALRLQVGLCIQVIFFPSSNQYKDPAVTRRVMDIYRFMNSKVLFKQVSPSAPRYPLTQTQQRWCSQPREGTQNPTQKGHPTALDCMWGLRFLRHWTLPLACH